MTERSPTLRQRLARPDILVCPGVFDALSASLAEAAGFEAVYLSGASIAYTRLGRPDIGLVSATEVADVLFRVRERVDLPIVVDADTGFGNALNVERTVRLFERSGAAAIQLEDQTFPKRCGHLRDKAVIPAAEMAGKIRAAVDARHDRETLVVARTDAIAVEGLEPALERAHLYAEAGADILFVEAPQSLDQMGEIVARLGGRAPLLANMVEGGATPLQGAADLERLGYSLVIFPGGLVRALAKTAQAYFASLREHGTTAPFRDRMHDFKELNALLGTEDILARGRRWEEGP
jgi:2-methylisocitrate lyase-like PEP mutase family enzyme